MAAGAPSDAWGDLLLDGLPDTGLLDGLQLDCGLGDHVLPPGLDGLDCCLDLDLGGADAVLDGTAYGGAAAAPTNSDLLDSLQLDSSTFVQPASSSGARHSPGSGSGSDSPVLPLLAAAPPPAAVFVGGGGLLQQPPTRGGNASPATSESENNGHGPTRAGSPAGSSQAQQAGSHGGAQRPMTEEEKRLARMQRNRENAQLSRQRKKQQMADLEQRCAALQQQNQQLTGAVQRLTAENATLRQQLALVCQAQAGRAAAGAAAPAAAAGAAAAARPAGASGAAAAAGAPAAAAPAARAVSPLTPGTAAAAAAAARPAATAVAAKGLLPQWPLLPFGLLPKVTISLQPQQQATQQQPVARPAPAAGAAPAAAVQPPPAAAAAGGRAPKRARTAAAGASTAFLALFTLFMFAGPFSPAPMTTPATGGDISTSMAAGIGAAGAGQRTLQALPDAATANLGSGGGGGGGGLHHAGRGLRALPAATSEAASTVVDTVDSQPPLVPPANAHPLPLDPSQHAEAVRGSHLQQLLNSTLQALLLEPGNAQLEAAALQRLQELGPVALLLDADETTTATGSGGSNPLAASQAFPHLAGQLFGSAGLAVPQMCQKVLEFDAASVPHATRSRRSLERYLLGATGFRGRSLSLAAPGQAPAVAASTDGGSKAWQPPLRIEESEGGVGGGSGEEPLLGEAQQQQQQEGGTQLMPTGGSGEGPVLVSILLPANASGGSNSSKLAAVDKVFVVLLHPQEKYVTYSCMLPRPVVL